MIEEIEQFRPFIIDTKDIEIIEEIHGGRKHKVLNKITNEYCLQSQILSQDDDISDFDHIVKHIKCLTSMKAHPAISKFVGVNFEEKKIFTEFVGGMTLKELISKKDEMSPEEFDTLRVKAIYALAFGLLHIHEAGVIHRNLNEYCIRFNNNAEPKLIDISKGKMMEENILFQSVLPRNDAFTAPEIVSNSDTYDRSIDIYSFGMLIYYISSCKTPYCSLNENQRNRKIIEEDFVFPNEIGNLGEFIQKACLSKNPLQRKEMVDIVDTLYEIKEPLFPNVNQDEINQYKKYLFEATEFNGVSKLISNASKEINQNLINQAEKGDIDAQMRLGKLCQIISKNNEEYKKCSFHYYKLAADGGNKTAMYYVGKMLIKGTGCETNVVEGYKYIKIAQEKPNEIIAARFENGKCLYNGIGVEKNVEMAKRIFKDLSDSYNHAKSQYMYAKSVEDTNEKEAFKYYEKAALNGCVEAKCEYSGYLYIAKGCDGDVRKAIENYSEAADQGSLDSMIALGCHYYNVGKEISDNQEKTNNFVISRSYFERGAKKGDPFCFYMIGCIYLYGYGVKKNINAAILNLSNAFKIYKEKNNTNDLHFIETCMKLGNIYNEEKWGIVDTDKAAMFYFDGTKTEKEESFFCIVEYAKIIKKNQGRNIITVMSLLNKVVTCSKKQCLINRASGLLEEIIPKK